MFCIKFIILSHFILEYYKSILLWQKNKSLVNSPLKIVNKGLGHNYLKPSQHER